MHIEHIAIWVSDLEVMTSFYVNYFGAQAGDIYENPSKQFTSRFLHFPEGSRLELMHAPWVKSRAHEVAQQQLGIIHFALAAGSKSKVDVLTEQLEKDGYSKLDGPRHTGDGYYESVFLDPENNRIEITV